MATPKTTTPEAGIDAERRRTPALMWPAEHPAFVLSIVALLSFAYLRLCLTRYLAPFHVTPDEIGFDYSATLARAVALGGLVCLFMAMLYGVPRLFGLRGRWLNVAAALFIGGFLGGLYYEAGALGTAAASADSSSSLVSFFPSAEPVDVSAASSSVFLPADLGNAIHHCLLFLGAANGFDVLFRPDNAETILVPTPLVELGVREPQAIAVCRAYSVSSRTSK